MTTLKLGHAEMPEKSIVLVEEDIGSVEKIFLASVVFDALASGKKVLYLSVLSTKQEVLKDMSGYSFYKEDLSKSNNLRIEGYFQNLSSIQELSEEYDVCIVDPFVFLVMDKDATHLIDFMNSLKKQSRKEGIQFYLSMDHGISAGQTENILRAMADGIIQFKEHLAGKRIERYVYIPKLKGKIPLNEMVPILVREDGITIDTRQAIR